MKRSVIFSVYILLFLLFFSHSTTATLYDRGNGLIYDEDLNITWLQYANYSGHTMTWDEAIIWAESLVYGGYDDWRLPTADYCTGYYCTGGELGHLFYEEGISSDTPGVFIDVRPYMYWSATEDPSNPSKAYRFNFKTGYQGISSKEYTRYVWAVRDGDSISVAPEPLSSVLFGIGSIIIGLRKYFRNT